MDDRQEPTLDGEASELAEARATIRRLNRRCQSAERGLAEKLEDAKRSGGSLGRGLANSAAVLYRARLDDAERERAAIARELGVEPTFDLATHLRGVLATRDAWVDQSAELLALQEESDEDVSHRAWVESLELRNAELSEELDSLRSESEAVKAERATAIEAMLKTLHESSSDYEAALESARSESEALRRDKERLDWLEANRPWIEPRSTKGVSWWRVTGPDGACRDADFRAAVDGAMSARSTLGIEGTNT